jgi:hypothetical protein
MSAQAVRLRLSLNGASATAIPIPDVRFYHSFRRINVWMDNN